MQEELTALKPQLEVSSKETSQLMEKIAAETADADKVKSIVSVEEAKANEEASKVQTIKKECEEDLEKAMPALNDAIKVSRDCEAAVAQRRRALIAASVAAAKGSRYVDEE